jgi:hypothetical protein
LGRIVFPQKICRLQQLQGNFRPDNVSNHLLLYAYRRFFSIDYLSFFFSCTY